MTDHENPFQPLADAAAAVDDRLPGAWARVAEYLEARKTSPLDVGEGDIIGKRKVDGDGNVAILVSGDLHTILDALEAVIDATIGPDEPAGDALSVDLSAEPAVLYADTDLRAEVEQVAITALQPYSSTPPKPDVVQGVVRAVWTPIERAALKAAALAADEEAAEHEDTCHGRTAAQAIARSILHGDPDGDRERDACSTTLVVPGLGALNAKLDTIIEHVSPLPTRIHYRFEAPTDPTVRGGDRA